MRQIYSSLLLLLFFSCGSINTEFRLQKSSLNSLKKALCLNENNCFLMDSDSSLTNIKLYYLNSNLKHKQLVDSVEFTPYKSIIHSFKSQKNNSYVILWETEYEYVPVILAYYIEDGKLLKMGELNISLPCQSCESFEYPINDIQIQQKNNDIEISFLKDVNPREKDNIQWKTYKPGALRLCFNRLGKNFKTCIIP